MNLIIKIIIGLVIVGIAIRIIIPICQGISRLYYHIRDKHDRKHGIYRTFGNGKPVYNTETDSYWADAEHKVHLELTDIEKDDDLEKADIAIRQFPMKIGNKSLTCIAANNLYLRDVDKEFKGNNNIPVTQIDEILITPVAVFMIECKTYSQYVQVIKDGERWNTGNHTVYSPIFQNRRHIEFFKKLIDEKIPEFEQSVENHKGDYPLYKLNDKQRLEAWKHLSKLPVYNVICFSDKTDVETIHNNEYWIIKVKDIVNDIKKATKKEYTHNNENAMLSLMDLTAIKEFMSDCFEYTTPELKKRHLEMAKRTEEGNLL